VAVKTAGVDRRVNFLITRTMPSTFRLRR
jgi:hypothetical protein